MRDFTEAEFKVQISNICDLIDSVVEISLTDEGYIDINHYFTQILSVTSLFLSESIHTVSDPGLDNLEMLIQNKRLYQDLVETLVKSDCPLPDITEIH